MNGLNLVSLHSDFCFYSRDTQGDMPGGPSRGSGTADSFIQSLAFLFSCYEYSHRATQHAVLAMHMLFSIDSG